MKVVLNNSEYNTKDINLIDGDKKIIIFFGGTGDLYWVLRNSNCDKDLEYTFDDFVITKENYQLYYLFEKLFDDIKNINIFNRDIDEFPFYVETDEDKIEYLKSLEEEKESYRKYNMSHYKDLYDGENNTITWVSDETAYEVGNILRIKKIDEEFILEFATQPYIEGYEREGSYIGSIGIRFRNSGSRYDPFNIIFMRMFQELQLIDDVNDNNHQIHIEEYLYSKKLELKKHD